MSGRREGCVVVLGAGASADAGYPMAKDFQQSFEREVERIAEADEALARQIADHVRAQVDAAASDPNTIVIPLVDPDAVDSSPSILEIFRTLWTSYEPAARRVPSLDHPDDLNGRPSAVTPTSSGPEFHPFSTPLYSDTGGTPHLEGFFAYYDRLLDPEFLQFLSMTTGQAEAYAIQLRRLREIAVDIAYKELSPVGKPLANYLASLHSITGPGGGPMVIATLNFDLALDRALHDSGIAYDDGFQFVDATPNPLESSGENPKRLWERAGNNLEQYVGFDTQRAEARVLKLHGSLGWYVLEEGNGDIGWPPLLRRNVSYATLRLRPAQIWEDDGPELPQRLAKGSPNDPALGGSTDVSRKAGAIWLRPLLEYAKSIKSHPSKVSTDLMSCFIDAMASAKSILVVGYSWGDPHVNDAVLEAVSRGGALVNLGYQAKPPNLLGLLGNKFPTTYESVSQRVDVFGGGARAILGDRRPTLPDGRVVDLDVVRAIDNLPAESSIAATH